MTETNYRLMEDSYMDQRINQLKDYEATYKKITGCPSSVGIEWDLAETELSLFELSRAVYKAWHAGALDLHQKEAYELVDMVLDVVAGRTDQVAVDLLQALDEQEEYSDLYTF